MSGTENGREARYTWIDRSPPANRVSALARSAQASPTLAALLLRLGVDSAEQAADFIHPRLANLEDPFLLTNLNRAVVRIQTALEAGEPILVFGDYDVDGVTSTTLMSGALMRLGGTVRYAVPRRLDEGYGLSIAALERALRELGAPGLLIAVDCGTNSAAETAWLRTKGVDVVVIDHHSCQGGPDPERIVVNPHVFDGEDHPWSDLCAVGLVFKVVHGLVKHLRTAGHHAASNFDLKEWLDLVALGTVADMVTLKGENRILTRHGLERLRTTRRPGLRALFEVSGMTQGDPVTPFDISFRIGPRINASGRLADATLPISLLLDDDEGNCRRIASELDTYNAERQSIERAIFEEADRIAVTLIEASEAGLILYNPDWHTGVVGIVASRIVQKYSRPCIVMGSENGMARGSGRSVGGINLVRILEQCQAVIHQWGGHPMAVGVVVLTTQVATLQRVFSEAVLAETRAEPPRKELEIATWIHPSDAGVHLLEDLDRLQPFGQGNPEPVFGMRGAVLGRPPSVFGRGATHVRFPVSGCTTQFVGWRMADNPPPHDKPVDLAFKLVWNTYNGARHAQAQLIDWRPAGG